MSFNIKTQRDAIHNLINKNNATGSSYDISSGLNERVQNVIAGYSKQPAGIDKTPMVFVEFRSHEEEFNQMGNVDSRDVFSEYDIIPIVDYGAGQANGRKKSDDDMITLTQNICDLFRTFHNVSSTVGWCRVAGTELDIAEGTDIYNSASRIRLSVFQKV